MEGDGSRRRHHIKALIVFLATLFGAGIVLGLASNSSEFAATTIIALSVVVGAYALLAELRRRGRSR